MRFCHVAGLAVIREIFMKSVSQIASAFRGKIGTTNNFYSSEVYDTIEMILYSRPAIKVKKI